MIITVFLITAILGFITYKLTSSLKFGIFVFVSPVIVLVMLVVGYILAVVTS